MENYDSVESMAKNLKESYPKLTDYESLLLAIQMQRNQILIAGLTVSQSDSHPASLEAIAIQLGFGQSTKTTVLDVLDEIASKE